MSAPFQGSFVALVTPSRNGKLDEAKVRELVELHASHGTDGIVPCGTTGESPTLSHDEHKRVVEVVIEAARGRLKVVAGTGSNSTAEAIDLTRHAERAGAAGALVVNPYYNKPTQDGLYRHFRAVAEMVHAALEGDWKRARDLHYRLFPLARAAFLETNPIPIKEAMAMAGMLEPEFRLPMCRMSDANRERLRAILTQYALVK